jgi:hypothetical protein
MCQDMNLCVLPGNKLAVHPDFIDRFQHGRALLAEHEG